MIVHSAWKPRKPGGIDGKRVLIVGYSHYCSGETELSDENLTQNVVNKVIDGRETHAFWTFIMRYFGHEQRSDFWPRVGFINYVPGPIGLEDNKFRAATEAELTGAADRLLDVMADQHAEVAFVLSSKASADLKKRLSPYAPETSRLVLDGFSNVRADYVFEDVRVERDGQTYRIVLAGHPQGAHRATMESMVSQVMSSLSA